MARERELKYDLGDEIAARRLEALLGTARSGRLQVNRFFDTADGQLRSRLWALRLRAEWEIGGAADPPDGGAAPDRPPARVVLSLKGPREGSGAFHDRREEQAELPADAWRRAAPAPAELPPSWRALLPPPGEALVERTRFANLRRTYPLTDRWRAEVDRTVFVDERRAWELEVEIGADDAPEAARALLEALLARAGVPVVPQGKSKLERALDRI